MKEEIQIEQGSRLADRQAPENLATERAGSFISERMAQKAGDSRRKSFFSFYTARPALAWSVSTIAFAAAIAAVVFLVPSEGSSVSGSQIFESESVHASSEVMDTAAVSASDTLNSFELPVAE